MVQVVKADNWWGNWGNLREAVNSLTDIDRYLYLGRHGDLVLAVYRVYPEETINNCVVYLIFLFRKDIGCYSFTCSKGCRMELAEEILDNFLLERENRSFYI